ncbi:MAG: methionyl-tRNA formyltransferase [Candidatus Shapirobacteria bacterium]|nr:methionyl-tRNA formyltransferase [Candidatus Shapirobacteria bacterium]MDD3002818.1 methionyl-tRNA formyltransferase [Candidatus Shapirobacteria bacterium]MDD4382760.1 methionyl-tRNA formyltransferase [Candidatus Shapirobacteria bacterium]
MVNLIFFGSSEYSLIILKKILEIKDFNLLAIVTKPDKAAGRNQEITANPVADFARQNNLDLLQPQDFDQEFINKFKELKPDLVIVVAYGPPYFNQEMIDTPQFKVVNIHPSPLPKYRGATPGPWQIINGETKTAVSFFQIDALPDHGPIISQIPFDISPIETATSFYQKAFNLAANNLETVIKKYIYDLQSTTHSLIPQDHTQKTYFPKFTKDSAQIDWSWDISKIERFIRALNPWPIAWTFVTNQQSQKIKMKILSASTTNQQLIPNTVQIEGKKIVNWSEICKYYTINKN